MAYEPNKTDLVSNKTGETLSKFTDYLEKQHKNNFNTDETRKIIRDVFWILFEDKDNIQSQDVKDFLDKNKKELEVFFQVEEIPLMKLENSVWGQLTKGERLGQSVQGFRTAVVDGKKINIPHISFSADLDYLDEVINNIIMKTRKLSNGE